MTDSIVVCSELRGELEAMRRRIGLVEDKLRQLDSVGETINELDDRSDALERRHDATESSLRETVETVRRLVNGVTARDLLLEKIDHHLSAIMAHIRGGAT